jgi:precorrin-6A synthase
MTRKILVIGIGAGNPEHLTQQAVAALNRADIMFVPTKGAEKRDLAAWRREICDRFITNRDYRIVEYEMPARDTPDPSYRQVVKVWHDEIEQRYLRLIGEELADNECGAFLAWGDPGLYDSVLRILESLRARGEVEFDYEVIPGITSVQALAAAHKIPLNRIGGSILITTGRKLAEGFPDGADTVVVMLDGQNAYRKLAEDLEIYWGAYLGTEDEILVAGKLSEVRGEIDRVREAARQRKGWIMDTYLLRKRSEEVE